MNGAHVLPVDHSTLLLVDELALVLRPGSGVRPDPDGEVPDHPAGEPGLVGLGLDEDRVVAVAALLDDHGDVDRRLEILEDRRAGAVELAVQLLGDLAGDPDEEPHLSGVLLEAGHLLQALDRGAAGSETLGPLRHEDGEVHGRLPVEHGGTEALLSGAAEVGEAGPVLDRAHHLARGPGQAVGADRVGVGAQAGVVRRPAQQSRVEHAGQVLGVAPAVARLLRGGHPEGGVADPPGAVTLGEAQEVGDLSLAGGAVHAVDEDLADFGFGVGAGRVGRNSEQAADRQSGDREQSEQTLHLRSPIGVEMGMIVRL